VYTGLYFKMLYVLLLLLLVRDIITMIIAMPIVHRKWKLMGLYYYTMCQSYKTERNSLLAGVAVPYGDTHSAFKKIKV